MHTTYIVVNTLGKRHRYINYKYRDSTPYYLVFISCFCYSKRLYGIVRLRSPVPYIMES